MPPPNAHVGGRSMRHSALPNEYYRRFRLAALFFPPFLPPLRELDLLLFLPRPLPLFLPPLSLLFTVAQARRSASFLLVPRFSYPSSMCSAFRFCFDVYFFLLPRAIIVPPSSLRI